MAKQSVNACSLAELAKKIEDCAAEVDNRTIEAAFLVRQLRSRIEAGEAGPVTWCQWAPKHINLCRSRLRELQRIAEADDPRAELARVRKLAAIALRGRLRRRFTGNQF